MCLRLIGEEYSEKFEELSSGMDLHYYDKAAIPGLQEPDIGKIYAAQVSSDWHRVKVREPAAEQRLFLNLLCSSPVFNDA